MKKRAAHHMKLFWSMTTIYTMVGHLHPEERALQAAHNKSHGPLGASLIMEILLSVRRGLLIILNHCSQYSCKPPGFLFVKLRRESRIRYGDFGEDEQEKYVSFAQSDTEVPGEVFEVHMGLFQEETWCPPLATVSALALLFWPQPFLTGLHGDLCPRGQA